MYGYRIQEEQNIHADMPESVQTIHTADTGISPSQKWVVKSQNSVYSYLSTLDFIVCRCLRPSSCYRLRAHADWIKNT